MVYYKGVAPLTLFMLVGFKFLLSRNMLPFMFILLILT